MEAILSLAEPTPSRTVREIIEQNALVGPQRTGAMRFWTKPELKVLRENYPQQGPEGCVALLPGRTAHSIYNRANKEKLSRIGIEKTPRKKRQVYAWSPQQDAAILAVYQGSPKRGAVKNLARMLGRPVGILSRRALDLGCLVPRFKELPWSEAEIAILKANGASSKPRSLARQLSKAGFKRSATAVQVKLSRLSIHREADEDHYTGRGLAEALGISRLRIPTLVARGLLKARKDRVSPGDVNEGDWLIHRRDVKTFVMENVAIIDFRKVDKFWLVDLLAGSVSGIGTGGRG